MSRWVVVGAVLLALAGCGAPGPDDRFMNDVRSAGLIADRDAVIREGHHVCQQLGLGESPDTVTFEVWSDSGSASTTQQQAAAVVQAARAAYCPT